MSTDPRAAPAAFALYDREGLLSSFDSEEAAFARVREIAAGKNPNLVISLTLIYEGSNGEYLGQIIDECLLEAAGAR